MATQPEKSHSTHAVFTFHYDKKDLKDASTASTTFQGVKLTVLPRTRARAPECSLCQWQAEGEWNRSSSLFPPQKGRDQPGKEVQFTPQEELQRKLIFCLHFVGAGPQGIQPTAKI